MKNMPPPDQPLHYRDDDIRKILRQTKTVAMIGASANWVRPSNFVMKYLLGKGYRVHPVNPGHAGKEILGQKVYASLSDIPGNVDMVDVFRGSAALPAIVEDIKPHIDDKNIKVLWAQISVRHDEAGHHAESLGLNVIMDRCPKIEYGRLFGELGWCGVNSGIITSKRRKLAP